MGALKPLPNPFLCAVGESPLPRLVSCVCNSTGKKFENPEMFGQYPLQVNGFKDLHECLEAAMNEGEIESAENCSRSGQEVSGPGAQQRRGTSPSSSMFFSF